MGIGEIAHYEQFLLFPQYFQMACFPGASKVVIAWEWVKVRDVFFFFLITWYIHFNTLKKKILKNIVEKGEIAQNEQISPFSKMFSMQSVS